MGASVHMRAYKFEHAACTVCTHRSVVDRQRADEAAVALARVGELDVERALQLYEESSTSSSCAMRASAVACLGCALAAVDAGRGG